MYRRLLIGGGSHLDQSEAYDNRDLYESTGPGIRYKSATIILPHEYHLSIGYI